MVSFMVTTAKKAAKGPFAAIYLLLFVPKDNIFSSNS